ncbi:chitin synthase-domain-containing protein [Xylaria digitata]|nr:chitin synthase-domain-containing protein [Xylaria digitata]
MRYPHDSVSGTGYSSACSSLGTSSYNDSLRDHKGQRVHLGRFVDYMRELQLPRQLCIPPPGYGNNITNLSIMGQAITAEEVAIIQNRRQAEKLGYPSQNLQDTVRQGKEGGPWYREPPNVEEALLPNENGSRTQSGHTAGSKATAAAEAADRMGLESAEESRRNVTLQKFLVILFIILVNIMLVFASWWWPKYYYVYLPLLSLPLVLNCVMIFDIIIWQLKNLVFKPTKEVPPTPETMVLLLPCYNETLEDCTKSLDSLTSQTGIDQYKKVILIICDGRVRGPNMERTTAQYLNEDILVDQFERRKIPAAYVAWDGQSMDVELSRGVYKGVPFLCIIKEQNQGKRDSLIFCRSFLYNFNRRYERPRIIFKPEFFGLLSQWLLYDGAIDRVDFVIGMDADTIFSPDCISHLIDESHYPRTVGVCGYVAVDFSGGNWNLWEIYQSAEYTIAQGLRRFHQSLVTHKVSCLPGCCQLIRVCEETCGDEILIKRFGYYPKPNDGIIRRIRATASEDRNHVCLMLIDTPNVRTRQALRACAYTDVPRTLSVFLSQRRRWTLGATVNDLLLVIRAPLFRFNPFERLLAASNVITWCLNPFVIASLASMVYSFMNQPFWLISIFASVMIVPVAYCLSMAIWMPQNALARAQYLLGLAIFLIFGPFINIGVTMYAWWCMDNFGWGKTRQVVSEVGEEDETDSQGERAPLKYTIFGPNEEFTASSSAPIPDLENQLSSPEVLTPFQAPMFHYPARPQHTQLLPHSLQQYQEQLDERESRVFSKDPDDWEIQFWNCFDGREVRVSTAVLSWTRLTKRLSRFIEASHSWAPLNCSREMLILLFTFHQVMPQFLDIVLSFGTVSGRDVPAAFYCRVFRYERFLGLNLRRFEIPQLGRSGHEIRHCYNLWSAERASEQQNP